MDGEGRGHKMIRTVHALNDDIPLNGDSRTGAGLVDRRIFLAYFDSADPSCTTEGTRLLTQHTTIPFLT